MTKKSLHFVVVAFLEQGHIIPALDLSLFLTQHGVMVTYVTTPVNLSRNQTFVDQAMDSDLPIKFLSLRFPCREVGLPGGCENLDLLPQDDVSAAAKFFSAARMMREPLQLHLQRSSPPPSCIISDFCCPWTCHVARELRIPLLVWYPLPCFTQACEHLLITHKSFEDRDDCDFPFVVPDFPVRVEITNSGGLIFSGHPSWKWMVEEISESESCSSGILVNSFSGLEAEYITLCEKLKGREVWPVGPVSLCHKRAADTASRGNKTTIEVGKCLDWLNSKESRSVLYVSFGSLVKCPLQQIVELGEGLEAAHCAVIWVINAGEDQPAVDEWLVDGFEERTEDRILIVKGWAPQLAILSHPSVGGFITHCGWNSVLEGISAGIPFITWPFFADQFGNERLLVDVLKVAIASGSKKRHWMERTISPENLVKREKVKSVVERLMGSSAEAHEMRTRAAEMGKAAKAAMEFGGSSEQNLSRLIEKIEQVVTHNFV